MILSAIYLSLLATCSGAQGSSVEYLVDVAVVGAGQAGMAAAHRLAGFGYSVHVLEASDYIG